MKSTRRHAEEFIAPYLATLARPLQSGSGIDLPLPSFNLQVHMGGVISTFLQELPASRA
jgi:hypothetical protein